jgi:hypothetical protein
MNYYKLKEHLGHYVVIIGYRENPTDEYQSISLECEDCNEVLESCDNPDL